MSNVARLPENVGDPKNGNGYFTGESSVHGGWFLRIIPIRGRTALRVFRPVTNTPADDSFVIFPIAISAVSRPMRRELLSQYNSAGTAGKPKRPRKPCLYFEYAKGCRLTLEITITRVAENPSTSAPVTTDTVCARRAIMIGWNKIDNAG